MLERLLRSDILGARSCRIDRRHALRYAIRLSDRRLVSVNTPIGPLEVGIRVERELRGTMAREHAATAYLTFVGVDDDGRPIEIPALITETDEERRREKDAQLRRRFRLKRRNALMERR